MRFSELNSMKFIIALQSRIVDLQYRVRFVALSSRLTSQPQQHKTSREHMKVETFLSLADDCFHVEIKTLRKTTPESGW